MCNVKNVFLFIVVVVLIFIITGCVETRQKEIQTDVNGFAEGTFVITQDAQFALVNYTCSKTDCNHSVNITIERWDKERVRNTIDFVKEGEVSSEIEPIKAKFGDRIMFKINSGCPNAKYTINFTLDSDS
jgi:preprotein translocase subunit YajC